MNKLSDLFRKRALLGVGVFCVAAIVTVGALSLGGNDEEENPDQLVDLNDQNPSDGDQQLADGTDKPEDKDDPQQVADGNTPDDKTDEPNGGEDQQQVADNPEKPEDKDDQQQVADNPEKPADKDGQQQVADDKDTTGGKTDKPDGKDNQQVADNTGKSDDTQGTEVLSPQVIAERLTYNKAEGLKWPIQGSVLIPYSPDHGVYYTTLDQFATSDALVIASEVGAEVFAAAKGVVVAIDEDVRTGMTVTLALGNNTNLVYGQLQTGELKVGDVLEAGECIGTVATPTRYYVMEGPNLYFQVLENGQSIDPTELLK